MKTFDILNLGAGVQSTCLYLMSMRQDEPDHVPAFDYAVFADTQEEPAEVYSHLDWLKSLGGPPILTRTYGKLGDDLIHGHHQVMRSESAKYRPGQEVAQAFSVPAFLLQDDGRIGIVRRKCTESYKINVVNRAIRQEILGLETRQRIPKGMEIIQWFGLSFDEPSRIIKLQKRALKEDWFRPRTPLFDLQMSRSDCLAYLKDVAPDRSIPRSACVFCPYHSNAEWRRIRDTDPDGWARAIEIDAAIRSPSAACGSDLVGKQYLHRSCKPLSEVDLETPESRGEQFQFGFAQECEGMCGV